VVLGPDGESLAAMDMPQVLTSWSRLYDMLHKAFPAERYLQGVTVGAVTQTDTQVTVQGQVNGAAQTWHADVLIASDGIRSGIRQQLAPEVQPEYVGYVAWRGVCDEAVLSNLTRQTVFEKFGFGLPHSEQLIGYPVAGEGNDTRVGHRAYNFVWYRPTTEASLKDLLTDADGVHYPGGIPPHKVSWRHIARMRDDAQRLMAPQFAEIVQKTAQPFLQPIYDMCSQQIAFDRIALMGDASFVARPHIGMGVTKAADDARALSDAIRSHGATPQALQAYQAQRLHEGQLAVQRAQWLGAYMQSQIKAVDVQRNSEEVMSETAIDLGRYGHLSKFNGATAHRSTSAAA
jgi:2-polyprenyl-6-methoxyphenol hydroxylase-like FAD-dependent oxidoreductase